MDSHNRPVDYRAPASDLPRVWGHSASRDTSVVGRDPRCAPLETPFFFCAVDNEVFLSVLSGRRRRMVSEGARRRKGEDQAREGREQGEPPGLAQPQEATESALLALLN